MLLRDRPLLQDRIDSAVYLSRPKVEEPLLRALRQGRNGLLVGSHGSGKTTMLRRVEAKLAEAGQRTVWINGALAYDSEGFLGEVEEALRELHRGESKESAVPSPRPGTLLAAARAIAAYPPTTILVDGLFDEEIGFDLFGRLRDELWGAGHVWLVTVTPQGSAVLRTPPADAFWSTVVEIPPLDQGEVRGLLEKGLEADERDRLMGISPSSGLYFRAVIRELERILEGDAGTDQKMGALIEKAAGIGRSESMAMTELIGLGRPASAHDTELLGRLGWSRAYAQRIFASLEAAGLVRSIPESSKERSGRPRKLYELNPGAVE